MRVAIKKGEKSVDPLIPRPTAISFFFFFFFAFFPVSLFPNFLFADHAFAAARRRATVKNSLSVDRVSPVNVLA